MYKLTSVLTGGHQPNTCLDGIHQGSAEDLMKTFDRSNPGNLPDTARIIAAGGNSEDTVFILPPWNIIGYRCATSPDDASSYAVKPRDNPATFCAKVHLLIYMAQIVLHIHLGTFWSHFVTRSVYSTYPSLADENTLKAV